MFVTTIDEARRLAVSGRVTRLSLATRQWLWLFGLAGSDLCAFALAYVLFRAGHSEPELHFASHVHYLRQGLSIDLFILLAAGFVALRALAGDTAAANRSGTESEASSPRSPSPPPRIC